MEHETDIDLTPEDSFAIGMSIGTMHPYTSEMTYEKYIKQSAEEGFIPAKIWMAERFMSLKQFDDAEALLINNTDFKSQYLLLAMRGLSNQDDFFQQLLSLEKKWPQHPDLVLAKSIALISNETTREEGLKNIMELSQQRFGPANYFLGMAYLNGVLNFESNILKGITHLRFSAMSGNSNAQANLAQIFFQGSHGVKQDTSIGLKWAIAASHFHSREGLFIVGICYEAGIILEKDYKAASGYYKRAAELGLFDAIGRLGFMYFHGLGVPQSPETAKILWKQNPDSPLSKNYLKEYFPEEYEKNKDSFS